jgi:hypothetical protein
LSHLVPQYMGLAVAKKKSIDHTFGGKRANDLPEKLESWGPGQVRSIEALEGELRATPDSPSSVQLAC